jgi:hypothetical protein
MTNQAIAEKQGYVICREKITSPWASRSYPWMPDDASCNCRCPVTLSAELMDFRCPLGHRFYATPKDILHD